MAGSPSRICDGLQALNLNADCRRAFMQLLGRSAEFADAHHGMEGTQEVDIERGRPDSISVKNCCTYF